MIIALSCSNEYRKLTTLSQPQTTSSSQTVSTQPSSIPKKSSPGSSTTIALPDPACVLNFKPAFKSTLYNTQVNVVGRHLSGLLLFKEMPDSSMRVVFTNEMGVKFFDFGYSADGSFTVYQVMKQLDKKNVITTLRSDLKLVMMRELQPEAATIKSLLSEIDQLWIAFPASGPGSKQTDTYYYITDKNCSELVRIEHAMKRKPKVQIIMKNYHDGVPDTIGITHRNFNFNIGLKYIDRSSIKTND